MENFKINFKDLKENMVVEIGTWEELTKLYGNDKENFRIGKRSNAFG
jgi:hypothetical protein